MAARSRAGSGLRRGAAPARDRRAGYLLIELAVALAVVALVMAFVFPRLPSRTSPMRLIALATASATLLRDARSGALLGDTDVAAVFDADRRVLRAGADTIPLPPDVDVRLVAGGRCPARGERAAILFRPDGTSCGGVLHLSAAGRTMRARVNWADGRIDVADGD